ncbi:MAG: FixH family protein [Flavobacteriales bacterium AspAUS03]
MQIKFHWGIGIVVLALFSYMSFIIYIAFIRPNMASELVSDRYYEEEIKYQETIDEKKNSAVLTERVKVLIVSNGIRIRFPAPFNAQNTVGEWFLLRPSNKHWDIRQQLTLDTQGEQLISAKDLKKGAYKLTLRWRSNRKKYLTEQTLVWKL